MNKERLPDYALSDLMLKVEADISGVIVRNASLSAHESDGLCFSVSAATVAIGMAAGFYKALNGPDATDEQIWDAIYDLIKRSSGDNAFTKAKDTPHG